MDLVGLELEPKMIDERVEKIPEVDDTEANVTVEKPVGRLLALRDSLDTVKLGLMLPKLEASDERTPELDSADSDDKDEDKDPSVLKDALAEADTEIETGSDKLGDDTDDEAGINEELSRFGMLG